MRHRRADFLDGGILSEGNLSLICRVSARLCAVPLEHVLETMRPLRIQPLAGAPSPVRGIAIIRGVPMPVVDVTWMLGGEASYPNRFVTVKAGSRQVALAVDAVVGVRTIPADALRGLSPLFGDASAQAVTAIGTLDADLLVVLNSARVVPETVWSALDAAGGVSP